MPQKIDLKDKKHIRCLFISKSGKSLYDYGLILDDYTFYQCQIRTIYKDLTTDLWLKLRHTFLPFLFTQTTDVCLTNDISVYEPIAYYLKILQEQIYFNMRFVEKLQIPRRIATYHNRYVDRDKPSQVKMSDINILWDKILKYKKCPWITDDINKILNESYSTYKKRMKYLRMAVYYMLIKQHLYYRYKKYRKSNIV